MHKYIHTHKLKRSTLRIRRAMLAYSIQAEGGHNVQANLASYPQRNGKWVGLPAKVRRCSAAGG